jgi:hypothetical protein
MYIEIKTYKESNLFSSPFFGVPAVGTDSFFVALRRALNRGYSRGCGRAGVCGRGCAGGCAVECGHG